MFSGQHFVSVTAPRRSSEGRSSTQSDELPSRDNYHSANGACDHITFEDREECAICANPSQGYRPSQHTTTLPIRSPRQLTPPPVEATRPRHSLDSASFSRPRAAFSSETLTSALASPNGGSAFYPRSIYQWDASATASDRSRSSTADQRQRLNSESTGTTSPFTPLLSRESSTRSSSISSNPDPRLTGAEYAPMAAGFARLSRRSQDSQDSSSRGRSRPLTDLGARMFDGPA